MFRTLALTVTALAVLAAAPDAGAQERRQYGLGIAANASFDEPTTGAYPYELYVPIRLGPAVKIEPSVGLNTGNGDDSDFSDFLVGIGVFAVRRVAAPFDLYYGGRLKLNFRNEDAGGEELSSTDFYLSGAAGGEYFVVPHFSLGLEANLGYYAFGELNDDQDGLFTTGLFFLRMYL